MLAEITNHNQNKLKNHQQQLAKMLDTRDNRIEKHQQVLDRSMREKLIE
jgi:hypothetical protein